ncbi:uncharacterized protein UDID_17049 [Ustilago sp. UG-2017a]|nr:uncharacterized protein UDID_17049 [Ustilago sp. UG-2017a]
MQDLTHAEAQENVSMLDIPRSDATADVYDSVSVLDSTCMESPDLSNLLGYTAFAATCSITSNSNIQMPTVSSHHLDHMAFAATVMDGTALIASGQQLRSADGILLEPLSLNEAKAHDDWPKWFIGVCWVYKLKLDTQRRATRYKARLVAQGYAQRQGLDYNQTFSPVIRLQTVRILLAVARRYRLHAIQLNVSTAFLNGKIDKYVYVRILPTFETKQTENQCYRLKKAPYGLKQAGRLWHAALDEQLQASGFKRCRAEPCVYMRGSDDAMVLLAVYVDDLLVIGATETRVKSVRQQLSSTFSITDQGNVSHIISLNVHYDREACTLSSNQSRYIEGVLTKFGMDEAWAASTLATETINTLGPREGDTASTKEVRYYASLVGSLLWITQGSRPDIAFAVGRCARFVVNLSGEHLTAAKHILRYLKGTVGISLSAGTHTSGRILAGWADSDWAGSRSCRRSTLGYTFVIDGLWEPPESYCVDVLARVTTMSTTGGRNPRAHAIASNPQHFKRTKHIDIAHFFLRDEVASRRLTIAPVQSSENIADILTKPLTTPTLVHIWELFGLTTLKEPTGLRGGAENDDPVTMLKGDMKPT